jgi:hypothetical protein
LGFGAGVVTMFDALGLGLALGVALPLALGVALPLAPGVALGWGGAELTCAGGVGSGAADRQTKPPRTAPRSAPEAR